MVRGVLDSPSTDKESEDEGENEPTDSEKKRHDKRRDGVIVEGAAKLGQTARSDCWPVAAPSYTTKLQGSCFPYIVSPSSVVNSPGCQ